MSAHRAEPESTPPDLSPTQLQNLLELTHEQCLLTGLLLKQPLSPRASQLRRSNRHPDLDEVSFPSSPSSSTSTPFLIPPPSASPLGVTLFPTVFPRRLFDQALEVQTKWNELYAKAVCDEAWIEQIMRDVVEEDELASTLWGIHVKGRETKELRERRKGVRDEKWELGVWRNDWMIERGEIGIVKDDGLREGMDVERTLELKQVEFNTIACAGACHGKRIADMHRLLTEMGIYNTHPSTSAPPGVRVVPAAEPQQLPPYTSSKLPSNDTPTTIVTALASAFTHYGQTFYCSPNLSLKYPLCILLPVQPFNINPFDELPILNTLISTHQIPTFRIEFPLAFSSTTKLDVDTGMLTFTPPLPENVTYEVAVLYLRAGHEMHEYKVHGGIGIEARVRIEASRVVLCPSVMGQLAGSKAVQAAFTRPENLRRFVDDEVAEEMGRGCAWMVSLASVEGKGIVKELLAGNADTNGWVLKPACAEGGGHNFFGKDVVDTLRRLSFPDDELAGYVLMKRIVSPPGVSNILVLTTGEVYSGDVIAELGIWGTCLFRRSQEGPNVGKAEIRSNEVAGWSVRTKKAEVDEISVVKGYGAFDSVMLVDDEEFVRKAKEDVRLSGDAESR